MKVLFRTDASAAMGTGHVMRCIALVQTMAETGADSVFLASTITPTLKTKLRDEGLKNLALAAAPYGEKDARETAMKAKELGVVLKEKIESNLKRNRHKGWGEVKAGKGSIRDVEFLTQYFQFKGISFFLHPNGVN